MTGSCGSRAANRLSFSSKSSWYWSSSNPNSGNDSMNDPRPRITSARPPESAVERREALEHPHGVVGAQHGDRRAEVDALGAPGDRGEHDLGRRHGELVAVVLADAEEVEAEPVGEHRLLDDVAQHLRVRQRRPVGSRRHVAEGVESEFVALSHRPVPIPASPCVRMLAATPVRPRLFPAPRRGHAGRADARPDGAGMRPAFRALPDDVDASIGARRREWRRGRDGTAGRSGSSVRARWAPPSPDSSWHPDTTCS